MANTKRDVSMALISVFAVACMPKSKSLSDVQSVQKSEIVTLLRPNINTFFKESTAILSTNQNAKRCGISKGSEVTLMEFPIPSNVDKKVAQKYYYGKLVSKGAVYAEVGNFCQTQSKGFIFKEHVDFVGQNKIVQNPTAESPSQATETKQDTQTDSPVQGQQPVGPAIVVGPQTTSGQYQGLPRQNHPIIRDVDDYVSIRTAAALESIERQNAEQAQAAQAQQNFVPSYYMIATQREKNTPKVTFYSKDGRTRIVGSNRPTVIPLYINGSTAPDVSAVPFKEWEGPSKLRALMAVDTSALSADSCTEVTDTGPSEFKQGNGFTSCNIPVDENGLAWLWIDCEHYIFNIRAKTNLEKLVPLSCKPITASRMFEIQP